MANLQTTELVQVKQRGLKCFGNNPENLTQSLIAGTKLKFLKLIGINPNRKVD